MLLQRLLKLFRKAPAAKELPPVNLKMNTTPSLRRNHSSSAVMDMEVCTQHRMRIEPDGYFLQGSPLLDPALTPLGRDLANAEPQTPTEAPSEPISDPTPSESCAAPIDAPSASNCDPSPIPDSSTYDNSPSYDSGSTYDCSSSYDSGSSFDSSSSVDTSSF